MDFGDSLQWEGMNFSAEAHWLTVGNKIWILKRKRESTLRFCEAPGHLEWEEGGWGRAANASVG